MVNRDGVTGIQVPPEDPGALASAVNRLLSEPQLRERMGAAGRKEFLERYTRDRMVESYIALYQRLRERP